MGIGYRRALPASATGAHKGTGVTKSFILTLTCVDRPGVVAAVATRLFDSGGNITEAQQFNDAESGLFFMRVVFDLDADAFDSGALQQNLAEVKARFDIDFTIWPAEQKKRVLLLASRFDHCLVDLLYRAQIGELNMDVVGIVSNHPKHALNIAAADRIPFHHFPVTRENKEAQEAAIKAVIAATGAELVVLARYMQILSNDMAAFLAGRCINIHHSFLPGFKGAKPYHQAHARGVKIIGATAHYVTADLDEGPIIVQDVEPIGHEDTPEDLVRKGRDIERRVLARAVLFHLEGRVFMNGAKTVVFRK
jgi:formyltetrahydrofolate deformylase